MNDCLVSDQDGCCVGCGLSISAVLGGRETCGGKKEKVSQTEVISLIEKYNEQRRDFAVYDSSVPEVLSIGNVRATELTFRGL